MSDPRGRGINLTNFVAGLAMVVLCGAFALKAPDYGIGRMARMGSGFYPLAFGLIGMVLGALIVARSFLYPGEHSNESDVELRWRPLLLIPAGVAAFGLLIESAGLLPAVFVSTVITAFADRDARPLGTALLGLGLTAGVWLVFVKGLGLPIPLLRAFG